MTDRPVCEPGGAHPVSLMLGRCRCGQFWTADGPPPFVRAALECVRHLRDGYEAILEGRDAPQWWMRFDELRDGVPFSLPMTADQAAVMVSAEDRVAPGADEAGDEDQDEPEGDLALEDLDDPDDSEDRSKQQQHGPPPTHRERRLRNAIAEILGNEVAYVGGVPEGWCGWEYECRVEILALTDRVIALVRSSDDG